MHAWRSRAWEQAIVAQGVRAPHLWTPAATRLYAESCRQIMAALCRALEGRMAPFCVAIELT